MKAVVGRVKTRLTARKLRKVTGDQWIAGVCASVAYWLGTPVWLTRLVWTCIVLFYGVGVGLYILLWIFVPEWEETPVDYKRATGD